MAKREEFAQSNKLFCFDTLFAMNAIGIVEKIFLSLDRVSLERCHFVSRAWSDVLSSEVFQRKKATLSKKMWMNTENLKHQLWVRHDRLPLYWAANSNEVAYFDLHMGMEPVYDLNYIGNDGELKTAPLHSEGSLWILNNTVLVVGGSCIYFFNKECPKVVCGFLRIQSWSLEEATSTSSTKNPWYHLHYRFLAHLIPALGTLMMDPTHSLKPLLESVLQCCPFKTPEGPPIGCGLDKYQWITGKNVSGRPILMRIS